MKLLKLYYYFLLIVSGSFLLSCNKKKFLDEKPSTDLFVPTTLNDFQELLDRDLIMS